MEDNEDELTTLKISKDKAKVLNQIIAERQAYDTLRYKLKENWIYLIGSLVVAFIVFYEKIIPYFGIKL